MKNTIKYIASFFLVLASYSLDAQCFDDGHSPFKNQGWYSCQTSVGPITARGDKHWLLYDFGHRYTVESLYLWNHNVWGETGAGVKNILIDYSDDQMNWKTAGPYTIDKAPGSWKYTGFQGPELGNLTGRYFLITVIDTWDDGSDCAGIGEIKFLLGETVDAEDTELHPEDWTVSPNPSSDLIHIDLPTQHRVERMVISNAVGQLMVDRALAAENRLTIPIYDLNDGMYYITLRSKSHAATKSFVKISR